MESVPRLRYCMLWDEQVLLATIGEWLRAYEASLAAENAVKGLDALEEVDLQVLIAQAIGSLGFGVTREFIYPSFILTKKGKRPRKFERARCDFVLTPSPDFKPLDTVRDEEDVECHAGTLFAREPRPVDTSRIDPSECYWLELKIVGQYLYVDGVPRSHGAYASTLVSSITEDLGKLTADDRILHGAVLLVHFAEDREIGKHDIPIALHRALDRGRLFRAPYTFTFELMDRIGNRVCTLTLIGKVTP